METIHQPATLTILFTKMIDNITSTKVYEKLKADLIEIHTIEQQENTSKTIPQKQKQTLPLRHQPKIVETNMKKNEHISEQLEYKIESASIITERKEEREVQSINRKNHNNQQNTTQQRQIKFIPLTYPTTYTAPNHYTQHTKEDVIQIKPGVRLSSEEQSINLQLTQKTKQTKNLSNNLAKQDSLLYSDATLMYSNATGFAAQTSQHVGLHKIQRAQSHKSALRKIQDSDQNQIGAKMERAVSREVQRGHRNTDQTSHEEQLHANIKSQPKESGIFQTEIADYKNKIAKIRQIKEKKKKLLESQLNKVNREIDELARKQSESPIAKNNNYESRVKIAENTVAKAKAQRLVRGLQREKKARFQAHLDEMQVMDKNINNYMQELMKQRYKNEERIKQKKKLQIIERMKQQQMRKIEQQKQKDFNIRFVNKLKESNSKQHIQPAIQPRPVVHSQNQNIKQDLIKKNEIINKQRTPTRKSQVAQQSEITPELSRKKAFLKKIRNISFKKDKADLYEQVLM